jgi:hypothetical protein
MAFENRLLGWPFFEETLTHELLSAFRAYRTPDPNRQNAWCVNKRFWGNYVIRTISRSDPDFTVLAGSHSIAETWDDRL